MALVCSSIYLLVAVVMVAPVTMLQLSTDQAKVAPTLYVINPSYVGHIDYWVQFVASVLSANETSDGCECSFGKTVFTTVVSNDTEREEFQKRLSTLQNKCTAGKPRINQFQIRTLEDTIRSTEAAPESRMTEVMDALSNEANKHYIQASKKFYGCLDAAGVQVNGSEAHPGDACVLVDSDSIMLKNSFCHLATEYMKKKTVFVSRSPNKYRTMHEDVLEFGRMVLNMSEGEDDEQFGAFYAMETYHWVFEVQLVQQYVQQVSMTHMLLGSTALGTRIGTHNGIPNGEEHSFFEETYYHFLYPRRASLGYNYVEAYDMLEEMVGESLFKRMFTAKPGRALFESLTDSFGQGVTVEQAGAIGKAFRENGILLARCSVGARYVEQFVAFIESLDLCASFYNYELDPYATCASQ